MPPVMPIKMALRHLTILGALEIRDQGQTEALLGVKANSKLLNSDPTKINKLGTLLSKVPLSPRYSKMLIVASKYDVIRYAIMMVACMSVNEIFADPEAKKSEDLQGLENAEAGLNEDIDPDLVTSLDIQRRDQINKKRRKLEKQANIN